MIMLISEISKTIPSSIPVSGPSSIKNWEPGWFTHYVIIDLSNALKIIRSLRASLVIAQVHLQLYKK